MPPRIPVKKASKKPKKPQPSPGLGAMSGSDVKKLKESLKASKLSKRSPGLGAMSGSDVKKLKESLQSILGSLAPALAANKASANRFKKTRGSKRYGPR